MIDLFSLGLCHGLLLLAALRLLNRQDLDDETTDSGDGLKPVERWGAPRA